MRRAGGTNLGAADLMQHAKRESAAEHLVERREAERQNPAPPSGRSRG
jgi:hypothetical protein